MEEIRIVLPFEPDPLSRHKADRALISVEITQFQHISEQIQTILKYYSHPSKIVPSSDKFENLSVSIFVVHDAQCKANYAFQYKKAVHWVH